MKRSTTAVLAGTATLALAAGAVLPAGAASAPGAAVDTGDRAFGITDTGRLVRFDLDAAGAARTIGPITRLTGDTELVGIDFRVQNRKLYGVGDQGGVYVISRTSGAARKVSQLTVDLDGTDFGVDFNPAADRLRIVSDAGQNLRHDVNTGGATIADGTLNTPPTAGTTTGVTAAAYTNNDLDAATATTLFDLNTTTDQVVVQSPANSGQLAPTGGFGVNAGPVAGFDIFSDLTDGRTTASTGWATLMTNGRAKLFHVALTDGDVTRRGIFPAGMQVVDLAVAPE